MKEDEPRAPRCSLCGKPMTRPEDVPEGLTADEIEKLTYICGECYLIEADVMGRA